MRLPKQSLVAGPLCGMLGLLALFGGGALASVKKGSSCANPFRVYLNKAGVLAGDGKYVDVQYRLETLPDGRGRSEFTWRPHGGSTKICAMRVTFAGGRTPYTSTKPLGGHKVFVTRPGQRPTTFVVTAAHR